MNKVAIIVQRCHDSVVGGSESLAWHYATILNDAYEVEILTTTALDISDWANVLPEGESQREGVKILRFPVTIGRSEYWRELYQRLIGGFKPLRVGRHRNVENPRRLDWSIQLQEEFIRNQGPHSEPLMQFIRERWPDYRALIFMTYLYPTSYFGLQQVPPGRALFAPTLHDEQPAYLSAYKHSAHRARELIWLTKAEQRVGHKLWGELPGRVVSMAVDTKPREPEVMSVPYLLYCGRVDQNKGCAQLFEYYFKYKRAFPSRLRLVLTGTEDMEIPPHPDIEFRGFVSDEEKFSLMAGASAYVMPSPNESLSIVTLEAMAQGTPVLASGGSEVLVDHINQSGGGRIYRDYESFAANLHQMLGDKSERREMGRRGREYVIAHYDIESIRKGLMQLIQEMPDPESSLGSANGGGLRKLSRNFDDPEGDSYRLSFCIGDQVETVPLIVHALGSEPQEKFYVRPQTFDVQIAEDVITTDEYALSDHLQNGDVVIDIGAHIGSFSYAAMKRGASKVYSYEAHPVNHAIALQNLARFGNKVVCLNLAVWRSDEASQTLYNDQLKGIHQPNTGGLAVLWNDQGTPVQTVSLDELLFEASAGLTKTVRLLKLDCEGSEYPILFTSKSLHIVEELCGEYHVIKPEEVPDRAKVGNSRDQCNGQGLKAFLEEQGFSVELEPRGLTDGIFHARRKQA